ncbi:MAG: type II toxin-antitoxin system VapC family toxin [Chloroflexota bacterium]|nr:type II toxin-antitoxin system VapC family toxin [Chloroflexota bacterium]
MSQRIKASTEDVATTIITAEETIYGWINKIRSSDNSAQRVLYYDRFSTVFKFFESWNKLPFDAAAAKYDELRSLKLRSIGTRDLQIAAIVLCQNATLLSANLKHFRLVPGLAVEDWLYS